MTALLAVEVRRVVSRRLVRVSAALAVLAILAGATVAFLVSREMDPARLSRAQAARRAAIERCVAGQLGQVPANVRPEDRGWWCADNVAPKAADRRFHYEQLPQVLMGTSPLAIILGWLLGASLVGAEWHTGTMATLLTWEPRRLRVLLAKAAMASLFVVALTVALLTLLGAALWPAGALRGTMPQAGSGWLGSTLGATLRSAGVAGLAAAVAFALAANCRSTAAALGIGFVQLAVVEAILRTVRPHWQHWLLGDNAAVVIGNQPQSLPLVDRSTPEAAALLVGYTAALLAVAAVTFRRRDVV
jgi:ABC-type transport system involved in multi-copper enzyme maturation permease subunit